MEQICNLSMRTWYKFFTLQYLALWFWFSHSKYFEIVSVVNESLTFEISCLSAWKLTLPSTTIRYLTFVKFMQDASFSLDMTAIDGIQPRESNSKRIKVSIVLHIKHYFCGKKYYGDLTISFNSTKANFQFSCGRNITRDSQCLDAQLRSPHSRQLKKSMLRYRNLSGFKFERSFAYEEIIRSLGTTFAHNWPSIQSCDNYERVFGVL